MEEQASQLLPYDYAISMSELCQLLGVTENTIRNYDKADAIHTRRWENGYRFYFFNDIQQVLMLKAYTSVGLSIREASRITKDANLGTTQAVLGETLERMEQQMRMLELQREFIKDMAADLSRLEAFFGRVRPCVRPALYWLGCQEQGQVRRDAAFRRTLKAWTRHIPFVQACNVMRRDGIGEQSVVELGYGVREKFAGTLPEKDLKEAVYYPERECLGVVVRANVSVADYYSVIQPITDYLERNGLELAEDIVSMLITTDTKTPWDEETCYDYHFCYFSVK